MTWLMPVQLLPFAGLLALGFAWPRISKRTTNARLFVEVMSIAIGTAAGCAAAWAVYWWVEQRW